MSDSKEEPVELVLQDYKFNPRSANLKMRWKKKTQLWLQTDGLKNRIKDR